MKERIKALEEALESLLVWQPPDGQEGVWDRARGVLNAASHEVEPVPMILHCPECRGRHIDEGEFAKKAHHTHACQHCGFVWRPAIVATCGVRFLPGFKNEVKA